MIEFTPIASSSAGCAYLLKGDGCGPLLLDAGLPFRKIQKAAGFQLSTIQGALITHAHGDHCASVLPLTHAGIDVYASAETLEQLEGVRHRLHAVESKQPFQVGNWQIMPFETVHDSPGSLGFIIAHPGGERLLYLTDTAYSKYRFDGLTHICIECNFALDIIRQGTAAGQICGRRYSRTISNHMSLERLIDMLRANDLSKVEEIWLLHLSDANSDEERFADEVRRATGKPVYVAGSSGGVTA